MSAIDSLSQDLARLQYAGEVAMKKGEKAIAWMCAEEARRVSEEIQQLEQSVPQTTHETQQPTTGRAL